MFDFEIARRVFSDELAKTERAFAELSGEELRKKYGNLSPRQLERLALPQKPTEVKQVNVDTKPSTQVANILKQKNPTLFAQLQKRKEQLAKEAVLPKELADKVKQISANNTLINNPRTKASTIEDLKAANASLENQLTESQKVLLEKYQRIQDDLREADALNTEEQALDWLKKQNKLEAAKVGAETNKKLIAQLGNMGDAFWSEILLSPSAAGDEHKLAEIGRKFEEAKDKGASSPSSDTKNGILQIVKQMQLLKDDYKKRASQNLKESTATANMQTEAEKVAGRLASSKDPKVLELVKQIQDMEERSDISEKNKRFEYARLIGQLAPAIFQDQAELQRMAKSEDRKQAVNDLNERLSKMSFPARMDELAKHINKEYPVPAGDRIKSELESQFGKDAASAITARIYSKNFDRDAFFGDMARLKEAQDKLNTSDAIDAKHKDNILYEMLANPGKEEAIISKYSNNKLSDGYFNKMRDISKKKLELERLIDQKDDKLNKQQLQNLNKQILDKRLELNKANQNLFGDTSKVDTLGAQLESVSTKLNNIRNSMAGKAIGSVDYNKLKKQESDLAEQQKNIYGQLKPQLDIIQDYQQSLPEEERNKYSKMGIARNYALESRKEAARAKQQEMARAREEAELEQEREANSKVVSRLKETWTNRLKDEPEYVQDKLKAQLASIGSKLSNDELQQAQFDLDRISKGRLPLVMPADTRPEGVKKEQEQLAKSATQQVAESLTPQIVSLPSITPNGETQIADGEKAKEEAELESRMKSPLAIAEIPGANIPQEANPQPNSTDIASAMSKLPDLYQERLNLINELKSASKERAGEINKRLQELESEINSTQGA